MSCARSVCAHVRALSVAWECRLIALLHDCRDCRDCGQAGKEGGRDEGRKGGREEGELAKSSFRLKKSAPKSHE